MLCCMYFIYFFYANLNNKHQTQYLLACRPVCWCTWKATLLEGPQSFSWLFFALAGLHSFTIHSAYDGFWPPHLFPHSNLIFLALDSNMIKIILMELCVIPGTSWRTKAIMTTKFIWVAKMVAVLEQGRTPLVTLDSFEISL